MLSPILTLNRPCDEALNWSSRNLRQNGLRVIQTFDLHTARHATEDALCPHHRKRPCDCQMIVLLVYGNEGEPVTLVLHGNDGQTWVSMVNNPRQAADPRTRSSIIQALQFNSTK